MERTKRATLVGIILLAIWFEISAVGLHIEQSRSLFQNLLFVNLVLSVGALALFHREWTVNFGIFAFAVFWIGYLVEFVGVKTGVIFGNFRFGEALGPKIGGVPPLIGFNWLILTYISGIIVQKWSSNLWVRATLGAILMVVIDLIMEPMAMSFDLWVWQNGIIPVQNFFAWFVIAWGMNYGFHVLHQEKSNPLAMPLFLIYVTYYLTFFVVQSGFPS
ncbi:MAG: carotenoid biosynthesis protein [Bacteroidota bacterium]